MEDLARYLDKIVEPTIRDFAANPTSVRHAFIACVVTFHAVDYLAHPRKSRSLRQLFCEQSSDFETIDHVAHAFKHVMTGPREKPILVAAAVISRPPARAGELVPGLSRVGDPDGGVTLANNREADLLGALRRAAAFLRSKVA